MPSRPSPARLVREFHRAAGQPVRIAACWPPYRERQLRRGLLAEEVLEFEEASEPEREPTTAREQRKVIAALARELADIVYVAYGAACHYGINLDAVVAEVHRANMDKIKAGATMRGDGKVLKPEGGWEPPDVERVIFRK